MPMKSYIILITLLITINVHLYSQTYDKFLIAESKVGKIGFDDDPNDIYFKFGKENVELADIYNEGLFTPALIVKSNGVGNLILFLNCNSIYQITVSDNRYETKDGIRVGSQFKDLKHLSGLGIIHMEGITYVTVNKSNIYYELNGIQLYELKPDLYPLYDVNNIPDKVTISHIIVENNQ